MASSINAAMFVPIPTPSSAEKCISLSTLSLQLPNNALANSEALFLGRSGVTRITEPRMSRRIAKVQWTWIETKPTLMIEALGGQGTVQINAKILQPEPTPLRQGDVVSLMSPDMATAYDYRVNMPSCLQQSNSQSTYESLASSVSKRKSPNVDASEEFLCAICLEIMAHPVTAVPCGHSFCGLCLVPTTMECPSCRAHLKAKPVPARSLGQAIALLVDSKPDLFSPDDVQQYLARNVPAQPLHPTSLARPKRAKFMSPNNPTGMSAENAIILD